jgi:hypothetical protein
LTVTYRTVTSNKKLYDGTVPSNKKLYEGTPKKRGVGGGKGREVVGGSGRGIGEGNFPLASVGSRVGGDNRKVNSTKRRVGLNARPTAGAPAPGSPVRASFP